MNVNNKIFVRRKNKVHLFLKTNSASLDGHIVAILKNISSLGYTLSESVITVLKTYSERDLEVFYLELVDILKKLKGANFRYHPMYPNFPKQVFETSNAELYLNAIIHYWSFGELLPAYKKEERTPLFDKTKTTLIDLGTETEFLKIFTNLCESKTSLSQVDKDDLEWFLKHKTVTRYLPKEILHKENLAHISKVLFINHGFIINNWFKTATDVLRFAVSLSDGDISLATNTKFKNFSRSQRRIILNLLNKCTNIQEDMLRYRSMWLRLGERLHPGEYKGYKNSWEAFNMLRNNDRKIETFNRKLSAALKDTSYFEALNILEDRPGELARKLDFLIRTANDPTQVISAFSSVAKNVSTPVLLQVREHFKMRNDGKKFRTFLPKGNLAKVYGIENTLPPINVKYCGRIVQECDTALITKYSELEPLGDVYLDPNLKNYIVPFSQRSASRSLKTIVRGSKLDIAPETKTIRSFIHWKNMSDGDGDRDRVDIDLSAIMYDKDFNYKEHISYTNLKSARYKAAHSGDITNAPHGASEFIDIDIESVKKYGGRYVVLSMYSYTMQPYKDVPECFMGFMERQFPNSGEIYEPKTVKNRIDVTSDTQVCIPMILDLEDMKVIWCDISLKAESNYHSNNVESNKKGLALMLRSIVDLVKPNLYDLFLLHTIARKGELVHDIKNADTIFISESVYDLKNKDEFNIVTPFDTDEIMGKYI